MPLHHGKSEHAFKENVRTEMHEGKPLKQSLAIAYNLKRRAAKHKMAQGGMMEHGEHCEPDCGHPEAGSDMPFVKEEEASGYMPHKYADGGFIKEEKSSGYHPMPEEHEKHDAAAMTEDDRMLNQHGAEEQGAEGMSEDNEPQHETMYAHPVENQEHDPEALDMVGRIMAQRQRHYSEGGKVANHTYKTADMEVNQFDDLVKDDDLSEHYTGANSGDELGDKQEDEDRHDIVSRVMKSRRLKDRYPSGYRP